ncbi:MULTISPECIES: integration host factor subunit beta [Snodgrassella]|uniref:Integration host factor subunit beta n=1 Tax=Snodgrassella alvi TaxID=1196083 RepID=A0A2N9X6M1_9NEIS|nr:MULTISPECIES: integration host factor subunit beta [Snodgrassella]MCX8745874.1 integration host factor subunit beta [Snodgrassella sp. B3800]MCX8748372.1 integration host factor subunit beta [Snodgrassella sp. B3088]MCX8752642.1 integration host factor subunit beta [Snodgrassella sp. B3837]PIT37814.1 integration host factor subunit beta [Snodgrassella alvi]PIT38824.1 integration host factor subunit beta [Snodgrassella alvi]
MTKSELMIRLAELYTVNNDSTILNAKDVEQSIKILVDTMTRALAKGQRIEIRGFGSFDLNHRPARIGRNPKTGEKVSVPEKYVPHFKPGKELRERVDKALLSADK